MTRNLKHEAVAEQFSRLSISPDRPGFCHGEDFRRVEERDAHLLEQYADFIWTRPRDGAYERHVESLVPRAAKFLYERLKAANLVLSCVDASLALSAFLDEAGIWNFAIRGCLTVVFPADTGLAPVRMCPVMAGSNPANTGHAWVVAPPFRVVDVACSVQPYRPEEARHVKGFVVEKSAQLMRYEMRDLFDEESFRNFVASEGRQPTMADLARRDPTLPARIDKYGCFELRRGSTTLRYTACGIGAADGPLGTLLRPVLDGKRPVELYADFARTVLEGTV